METLLLKGRRFVFVSHLDFNLFRFRLPIMQALRREGAEVWAITPPGPWAKRFADFGVNFLPWSINRRTLSPVAGFGSVQALLSLLRQVQPDLVHSFTHRPNLYVGLAQRLGVPGRWIASVTGLGNLYLEEGWRWRLVRCSIEGLQRWGLSLADAVIFQNQDDLRYYLQRRLCTNRQAHLIRGSGVDVRAFSPDKVAEQERQRLRREWGIPEDAFVVIMIARLIRAKGVNEFLQAAQILANSVENIYFVLVGDPDPGNPSSLTEEEIARLRRLPRLVLPGFQDRVELWLSIADVYVLPSYREGLPRTVLEAMAMGLPVITTDVPGCRETVEPGRNGFLIPPRDAEALRTKILWLAQHLSECRRMGFTSRQKVEQEFSVDIVVSQHLALYRQILSF